jgi:protein-S-isoprenylcysteine O-methyltransferase Ste14
VASRKDRIDAYVRWLWPVWVLVLIGICLGFAGSLISLNDPWWIRLLLMAPTAALLLVAIWALEQVLGRIIDSERAIWAAQQKEADRG